MRGRNLDADRSARDRIQMGFGTALSIVVNQHLGHIPFTNQLDGIA
ncbi:hypothetical protein RISK_004850 [Rhodopirellula islandica]|uniref:Uncharacterized protein n=1 Tax=Rhodopirellula islandica TaxID=595434 RepID=A0A0J1EBX7_RHOIS|nr:hypothetical protein RISK_004850 [Rhodopirellula islandica]